MSVLFISCHERNGTVTTSILFQFDYNRKWIWSFKFSSFFNFSKRLKFYYKLQNYLNLKTLDETK